MTERKVSNETFSQEFVCGCGAILAFDKAGRKFYRWLSLGKNLKLKGTK